jgi:hypothetical protein
MSDLLTARPTLPLTLLMLEQPPAHICLIADQLELSMKDLGATFGIEWRSVRETTVGPWQIRMTYSRVGPTYWEVIEADGEFWHPQDGGPFHHVGFWSDDLDRDRAALRDRGMTMEIDGREWGRTMSFHRSADTGIRVELLDIGGRERWLEPWT